MKLFVFLRILEFFHFHPKRLDAGELQGGEITRNENGTNQQAAWMMVARSVMNLDEAITNP